MTINYLKAIVDGMCEIFQGFLVLINFIIICDSCQNWPINATPYIQITLEKSYENEEYSISRDKKMINVG